MTVVTIHEAKTNLSRLIARVLAGEEVTIARGKEPVVKLMPVKEVTKPKRVLGTLKGTIDLDAGFWDPLPEEYLALWNGEDSPEAQ
ncbi:type II toxin-antitoxin system Phd/YefM family antitoxin [Sphingopyxis sp.]|uniref:type II toxin-antitoxin system Phd/YefM family antitoxin n=1 Tax=Sphingopyxis sp. TaxID=1908224 RepID=UPI001D72C47A|nr:type II toxin-antitoxin system prevent-host-death family antitoxin [Sphingopyxis sp.]MBW8294931.1 type II toxin-antitoxin system prevent-host-death family antitoxin [Sphingopyxis sp.]